MVRVYGRPFDRQAQVSRWIRRGTANLVSGRSEVAAEVVLDNGGRPDRVSAPGVQGPDNTIGISRSFRILRARVNGSGGILSRPFQTWITSGGFVSTPQQFDPPNDIGALPRSQRVTLGAANSTAGFVLSGGGRWVLGRGDGSGGFLSAFQFAVPAVTATGSWFVGIRSTSEPGYVLGVGQDQGDAAPFFMHTNASPAIVKTPTGLASIAGSQLCEVRLYSNPFGAGAKMSLEVLASGVIARAATFDTGSGPVNPPLLSWSAVYSVGNGTAGGTGSSICFIGFFHEFQPVL